MDHALDALPVYANDGSYELAINYMSRIMIVAKYRYNLVENEYFRLVFLVQKVHNSLVG